jgi:uncharacterized tellurite resistance protein B-like protein
MRDLLWVVRRRATEGKEGLWNLPLAGAIADALGTRSAPSRRLTSERRLHAVLMGALLQRVARADRSARDDEWERIRTVLASHGRFSAEEIEVVLEAIESGQAREADRQRLCAEFNRISQMEERLELLHGLFAVALADGDLSPEEEREIRLIGNFLWIEPQEFVRVRREARAAGEGR